MSKWKTYGALLFTLALIALGAAMPWLAGRMQDAGMSRQQERLELNAVSLTLREGAGVAPILRLLSGGYSSIPWTGETGRTEEEVHMAALELIRALDQAGLLPVGDRERLEWSEFRAEPILLIGENGSTALAWDCDWDDTEIYYIKVDDASGKAVQIAVSRLTYWEEAETETKLWAEKAGELTVSMEEGVMLEQVKKWVAFLEEYYGIVSVNLTEELNDAASRWFRIDFDFQDGTELCPLELWVFENIIAFNIR